MSFHKVVAIVGEIFIFCHELQTQMLDNDNDIVICLRFLFVCFFSFHFLWHYALCIYNISCIFNCYQWVKCWKCTRSSSIINKCLVFSELHGYILVTCLGNMILNIVYMCSIREGSERSITLSHVATKYRWKHKYNQTSIIRGALGGNTIVDHSDIVGALHIHSRFNTWFQWIGQSQLPDEARKFSDLVGLILEVWR